MNKQIILKSDPIEYGGMLASWADYRNEYPNFGNRKSYGGRSHPAHYEIECYPFNNYTVVIYETKKYIMIEVQV
tara:strand:+ start:308 stop:529 length:222 start_codon:yes stop_codon:yes gene_type:complete